VLLDKNSPPENPARFVILNQQFEARDAMDVPAVANILGTLGAV
jgi:hypothetical protein